MNHVQSAVVELEQAIVLLKRAKHKLLLGKSDHHLPLAVQLAALEEIHETLTDPECTPEIEERG